MSVPRPAMLVAMSPCGRSGLRDNGGFPCVILRVQHFVANAAPNQHARQLLRLLDGYRTYQHRLPAPVTLRDLITNRVQLVLFREKYDIISSSL